MQKPCVQSPVPTDREREMGRKRERGKGREEGDRERILRNIHTRAKTMMINTLIIIQPITL